MIRVVVPIATSFVALVVLYGFGDDLNESLEGEGALVFFLIVAPLSGILGSLPGLEPRSYALGAAIPTVVLPFAMLIRFPFHAHEPWFPHPIEALLWGLTMLTSLVVVGAALLAVHSARLRRRPQE